MSVHPSENQAIYDALLKKAASYPKDKYFQRKNYEGAANKVHSLWHNLYSVNLDDSASVCDNIQSYFGPKTSEFIIDFIKNNPLVKQKKEVKEEKSESKCAHPANEDIYKSLNEKANSYPADKIYQKAAYMKAAKKIADLDVNLWAVPTLEYFKILDTFGPSTYSHIDDFITDNYNDSYLKITKDESSATYGEQKSDDEKAVALHKSYMEDVMVKENTGLYNALIKKAESYKDNQEFQKKAYLKAANMVATADFSYYSEEGEDDISMYWGPKTGDFAFEYLEQNPLKV